jgi:hypothetical protein
VERAAPARRDVLTALGLAVLVAGALILAFGRINLDLLDEGFLWYGTIQTRAGGVPLRDFQSYEPGRYYWCVAWSYLFGQGILAMRLSLAIVQAIGIFLGLLVCRRVMRSVPALAICAVVLGAWMFPRHKSFEATIAIGAVWIGVRLLEMPTARRLFAAGVYTGLAAWFGRNHGLYTGLAFGSMALVLLRAGRIPSLRFAITALVPGFVLGSAPLWGMLLFVPGFASALGESIAFNLTRAINLPIPYPFPWRVSFRGLHGFDLLAVSSTAVAFALPLLLYPIGLLLTAASRPERIAERAPMIAATLVGVFYLHHASVRSDISHLAQVIHPLLILTIALPAAISARALVRVPVLVAIALVTLFATLNANAAYMHLRPGAQPSLVEHNVAGDWLRLPSAQAEQLSQIEVAIAKHATPGTTVFIAPTRPGLYPVLGRKSPDWWLYFLFPASTASQRRTIEHLDRTNVSLALLVDEAIDGREELRFRNSNPLVWEYLTGWFIDAGGPPLPPGYRLLRRRTR